MFERIIGIAFYKTPIYREIAGDRTATEQAAILVIAVALIQGLCSYLAAVIANDASITLGRTILSIALIVILGLVVWAVIAWLLVFMIKLFGGKTGIGEMLRVAGFIQVFDLASILTLLVLINPAFSFIYPLITAVIFVLRLIGYFVAARHVTGLAAGKAITMAILVSAISWVAIFLLDYISNASLPSLLWVVR